MVAYRARQGQVAYGFSIGILCLDCNIPFVPGDVGNASTYDFPVMYLRVPGATPEAVIERQDPALAEAVVESGRQLAAQGVRAITSDCGYFGQYQQALAAAVPVPVFLSSLMQVPLVLSMLAPGEKLGVLVANAEAVSERVLSAVGIVERSRVVFAGLEARPHFREVIFDESAALDRERMEAEVVQTALELREAEPALGALLLECSDLPPYGAAVQKATGLPVFDWIGFIEYVHHAVVRQPYGGFF